MNLNQALRSTRDLKRITYRMLRKLHRIKTRRSFKNSYKFGDEYCIILYLQHMVETIEGVYMKKEENVVKYLNEIITLLRIKTKEDLMIHHSLLVSCLRRHTQVFNWLKRNKISLIKTQEILILWTTQCVPAYVAQFRNKI